MTFAKDALRQIDRARGGFWFPTMYGKDYFMLPKSPNGRTNIGGVSLDVNETRICFRWLPHDLYVARASNACGCPRELALALEGQFALIVRAYVPTQSILDGSYKLPTVQRQ